MRMIYTMYSLGMRYPRGAVGSHGRGSQVWSALGCCTFGAEPKLVLHSLRWIYDIACFKWSGLDLEVLYGAQILPESASRERPQVVLRAEVLLPDLRAGDHRRRHGWHQLRLVEG